MGISPGFGSFLSFAAGGLAIAALVSSSWISSAYQGSDYSFGVSRACVSVNGEEACNFYFVSVKFIAEQPWGWPSTAWQTAMFLMFFGLACSVVSWIVGTIASCMLCFCCVSIPLSAISAVFALGATALYTGSICMFCSAAQLPMWNMFAKGGDASPVCGTTAASYNFGVCDPRWGFYVAISAAACSLVSFIAFFPTFCSSPKPSSKLGHGYA
eukprot:comp12596_c0_seq1/m.7616 comp12596_c0_seq1/g.7616  ORF comp12596_c0_seq1/g.7616 comp12596_c0_seq1/m.7616 type:complete len:213 (-) comp12596_c0_seq1:469-1107(-)